MRLDHRVLASALALALVGAGTVVPRAQQAEFTNNFRYNKGQSIQPIFEGWSWAPDGSINMHFGYLNRNYAETPEIPVGPNNRIEPGGPDRGQPTFFYTRTNRNLFTVNVPRTWGQKDEVVWTLVHNEKTERAVGWLQPEWEIDPVGGASGGGNTDPERTANTAPTVAVSPVPGVRLPSDVTLVANLTDDGLPVPKKRGKPPVGQETPPTLLGGTDAPVNVPQAAPRETPPGATAGPDARPLGLVVSWMVWRGPGPVTFMPRYAPNADGKAETKATFSVPGEYVLRATADDSMATAITTVTVRVSGGASTTGQPR
ncbi:MAG: hypothetical protein R2712_09010 [Vicinamibacterales bacterium]